MRRLTSCDRGGEEVLLDVGGQDATEPFEDVGHSDEAREILDGLLVGNLKRMVCCSHAQGLHFPPCACAPYPQHPFRGSSGHCFIDVPYPKTCSLTSNRFRSQATRPPRHPPQKHQQAQQASQKLEAWASGSTRSYWWEVSLHLEPTSTFR